MTIRFAPLPEVPASRMHIEKTYDDDPKRTHVLFGGYRWEEEKLKNWLKSAGASLIKIVRPRRDHESMEIHFKWKTAAG